MGRRWAPGLSGAYGKMKSITWVIAGVQADEEPVEEEEELSASRKARIEAELGREDEELVVVVTDLASKYGEDTYMLLGKAGERASERAFSFRR